jgi:hypothetical protein
LPYSFCDLFALLFKVSYFIYGVCGQLIWLWDSRVCFWWYQLLFIIFNILAIRKMAFSLWRIHSFEIVGTILPVMQNYKILNYTIVKISEFVICLHLCASLNVYSHILRGCVALGKVWDD